MTGTRYRLSWEMVSAIGPGAQFYFNEEPLLGLLPEDVPDEFWHTVTNERGDLGDIEDQARTLRKWADEGTQLIRNVRLERANEPEFEEVDL